MAASPEPCADGVCTQQKCSCRVTHSWVAAELREEQGALTPLEGLSLDSLLSQWWELNEFRHLLVFFPQAGEFPMYGFGCRYLNSTQTPLFGIYPVSVFPSSSESSLSFFRAGGSRKKAEHPWKAQLRRSHWGRGMLSLTMTTCLFSPSDAHIGWVLPASPETQLSLHYVSPAKQGASQQRKELQGTAPVHVPITGTNITCRNNSSRLDLQGPSLGDISLRGDLGQRETTGQTSGQVEHTHLLIPRTPAAGTELAAGLRQRLLPSMACSGHSSGVAQLQRSSPP